MALASKESCTANDLLSVAGPERQKTAEKMMDDAEGAGGQGYS